MWIKVTPTNIQDVRIIEPQVFSDKRGFFMETYNEEELRKNWIKAKFIQDNLSKSAKWVARWFHVQTMDTQAKLVRASVWTILDIAIDLRRTTSTYGRIVSEILSAENKKQLFIPRGFWHAFIALEDWTEVVYKTDNIYNPKFDNWINIFDPELLIDWQQIEEKYWIKKEDLILSEKDKQLPSFREFHNNVRYWFQ